MPDTTTQVMAAPRAPSVHRRVYEGARFGLLTVLRIGPKKPDKYKHRLWWCACDCGSKELLVYGSALRSANTQSCGCVRSKKSGDRVRTHGLSGFYTRTRIPEYGVWLSMRKRCMSSKELSYANYGGRGIKVCERWNDFTLFMADMGRRPEGTSIDRIDVNGHYEPGNCRWATDQQQAQNRRNTRRVTIEGVTLPLIEWERQASVCRATILNRLHAGLTTRTELLGPARIKHRKPTVTRP